MSGNYRFAMDQKDIVRLLVTSVGSFIQDRLINKEERILHKEQCAERLAAEDESYDKNSQVRYSDQAVLANLDWGMEALEEAINTSNMETKLARLDYAEKMLQVCAMLDSNQKTAGVPNFYLSAWAHLNLSYLCKLKNDVQNSVLHILEMFIIDPFFSRIDFAPEFWKEIFLPQMGSIVGWYSESRQRLVMEVIPDSADLSFTADYDQFFNESLISSMRPDQVEKIQNLEQLYGESLDKNTRLFAKYYKDCLKADSTTKKVVPMLPIAEAPVTPLNEISRSIPDYVKFGPILPKSAGFSPVLKSKDHPKQPSSRLTMTSSFSHNREESSTWDMEEFIEDNKSYSDYELNDDDYNEDSGIVSPCRSKTSETEQMVTKAHTSTLNSRVNSPESSSKASSPKTEGLRNKKSPSMLRLLSNRFTDSTSANFSPVSLAKSNDRSICRADSDVEALESRREKNILTRSTSYDNVQMQALKNSPPDENDEGNQNYVSLPSSEKLSTTGSRPPKDFVCPITSQIFNDPVTLETGQTYERKAIQEWLKRGNTTCPITRQPLSTNALPKTNYVLRRLITSWTEQYPDLAQEFSYSETPRNSYNRKSPLAVISSRTFDYPNPKCEDEYINQRTRRFVQTSIALSPTSVLSQAAVEAIINGLKPHVSLICTSENLQECEKAILEITRLWKESNGDSEVHSFLSTPAVINGLIEILLASLNRDILRKTICILSELLCSDETVGETLSNVDSDFDCLASLLKHGLMETSVLIYQLQPSFAQLSAHDLIPCLVQIIMNKNEELDDLRFVMEPKDAALALLEHILIGGDENSRFVNAMSVVSESGVPALVKCLDEVEARRSVVCVLLCCMRADKRCRNVIAARIEVSLVLELFHSGNDCVRGLCVDFLSELAQLHRRTSCNLILQSIKDEGAFSTMHTFLVYLQMAPMEQQPAIASLLLQLDLLDEPRKMSIYREEAIDTLIEALRRKEFSHCQMKALDVLLSLSGRRTLSGNSCIEAWLLKIAGFDQPYNALMNADHSRKHGNDLEQTMEEEEKAVTSWERNLVFVICNHEKGIIFKALEECFKSKSLEIAKSSLIAATWLIHMHSALPDTGVREVARKRLLDVFINVLQSSKNLEEKILATLALKSFVKDQSALEELGKYAKCIYKTLRKLKRNSVVVNDIQKALMSLSSVDASELWSCTEVLELDLSQNGEVLSLVQLKGRIASSHSDGTIKVWDAGKKVLRLVQETREHTKAVTCLYVSPSGDKLYSGSLDKTIREEIHCVQVHDVKESVHDLIANTKYACFTSQGTGVKVYNWSDIPRHINFSKHVKSLAMAGDKLYCGCSAYSIQEVDLLNFSSQTFYSGTRKLLGKQIMHALHIQDGLLFAGGSSVDGTAGKVFNLSTKAVTGMFTTGLDIQQIAVNNDFIFTATRCGNIEIWLKDRVSRIASIKLGHVKIMALVTDMDVGVLYAGSSDELDYGVRLTAPIKALH
ncbi:hypothetical protein ACFE04_015309 [Oxalis oulophora]